MTTEPPFHRPRRKWKIVRFLCVLMLVAFLGAGGWYWLTRRSPQARTEIYRGVFYTCVDLPESADGGGLVHLVEVDLTAPGIELYVTPTQGTNTFLLKDVATVVEKNRLAAAVNGTLFRTPSRWWPRVGDPASAVETVISEGVVSHVDPHTYLLWFEKDLTAHMEETKPPSVDVLARAWWGMGSQVAPLFRGQIMDVGGAEPDERTFIGIDRAGNRMWMATFASANYKLAARTLLEQGAYYGAAMDGGDSTSMALGADAHGVKPGKLIRGWRPVANQFGVRANPMK